MAENVVSAAKSLAGKRVFVTGATGFIGSHVARRLNQEGARVLALEHSPGKGARLAGEGIELVSGDLSDATRMEPIIRSGIEVVMHLGAWLRGKPYSVVEATNVAATRQLAEASAKAGIERFVFTSSIAVYGLHGDRDVDETAVLTPYGDPYGDSKIRAEAVLREVGQRAGLPFAIVRPGMVYGPESPGWTVRLAKWAKQGRLPIIEGGRGLAYPVYIDNLVDLLILCAAHPAAVRETFNGVDDGPVTLGDFLGDYMAMVPTNRAIRLPGWVAQIAAVVIDPFTPELSYRYVISQMRGRGRVFNDHAKQLLGWYPRISLEEGQHRSEKWLRSQGIL